MLGQGKSAHLREFLALLLIFIIVIKSGNVVGGGGVFDPVESFEEEGNASPYCLGGPDPTCYFDEDDDFDGFDELEEQKNQIDVSVMNDTTLGTDNNLVRVPRSLKDVSKGVANKGPPKPKPLANAAGNTNKAKTLIVPTTPTTPLTTTPSLDDLDDDDDRIAVYPLASENEMSEVHLKEFEGDNVYVSFYPPWTYDGFYSPGEWDKIPAHYFASRSRKKQTKLGEMLSSHHTYQEGGRSFMQFGVNGTPSICTSEFPSPIDIIPANAREEVNFVEFNMMNHDVAYAFTMFIPEDGTDLLFVKLQTPLKSVSKKPSIDKGNVLGPSLTLDRILIHFGSLHTHGSEHYLNGKSFGMELQFMFTLQEKQKENTYYDILYDYTTNKDESTFGKNQLALCILVEVAPPGEKVAPSGKEYNEAMSYLALTAAQFSTSNNKKKYRAYMVKKKRLRMIDFFKVPFKGHYYTYFGSLTHPPCFNNTRYSVFEKSIYIKYETWQKFQFLPSGFSDTGFLADNFRPLESIRVVSNGTRAGEILPYLNPEMRENISYTVLKSRFSTSDERMVEYDYDEDTKVTKSITSKPFILSSFIFLIVFTTFLF